MLPDKEVLPRLTREGANKCFGCGQENPIGLKLRFYRNEDRVETEFIPNECHQGWPGIVHGGILCTLLDEAMGYAIYHQGINCVTAKMEVKLKHPAPIEKPLLISAIIAEKTERLIQTKATITLKDGSVVAEGTALMWVISKEEK